MKILRLTVRNLASLAGTQTIDFERDPLRSTGLFAISGATGSGKSTLLDALCVALYEDTPRLSAANGTKLPDTGNSEITQKDPGNLLRRGAAEGFSEVAFVGVDGAVYTARWSIRRARQRHDGALQASEMALYQGNVRDGQGQLACGGRKSEVLPAIAAKVGLTFEQFTRAVLLAQNEFAEFLKSDDKERAEILQALTGTERFERISRAVYERHKAELEAVQALQAKADGQLPLTAEARAAADEALRRESEAVTQIRERIAVRAKQAEWFGRARELAAGLSAAQSELTQARQTQEQAAERRAAWTEADYVGRNCRSRYEAERGALGRLAEAEKALTDAKAAAAKAEQSLAEIRARHTTAEQKATAASQALTAAATPFQQARALDVQLVPAAERLTEKGRERQSAETAQAGYQQRLTKLSGETTEVAGKRAAAQTKRQNLAAFAPALPEAAAWIERLKRSLQTAADLVDHTTRRNEKQAAEAKARATLETARREQREKANAYAEQEQKRVAAETACRQFDPEALAAERRGLQTRIEAIRELQHALEKADSLGARLAETKRALDAAQAAGATARRDLAETEGKLPAAETRWQATRDSRALAEATVEQHTRVLRERLRPDAACPVCGSLEHPYAAHAPVVDATLQALRDKEAREETLLKELRDAKTRLTAQIAAQAEHAATQATEHAKRQAEHATAQERITPLLGPAGLGAVSAEHLRGAIATAGSQVEQARQTFEQKESAQRQAAKHFDDVRQIAERARLAVAQAEKTGASAETDVAKALAELQSVQDTLERAVKSRDEAAAAVAGLFALLPPDAAQQFKADGAPFIRVFTRDSTELRRLEEELAAGERQAESLRLQTDEVRKAFDVAERDVKARVDEEAQARAAHDKLKADRAAVLGGRPAADVERELTTAVEQAKVALDTATLQLGDASKAQASAAATVSGAQQALEQAKLRVGEARAAVDAMLVQFAGDRGRELNRKQLSAILDRPVAWLDGERQALEALDHAVKKSEGAVTACTQAAERHQATRPTTDDEPVVLAALEAARGEEAEAEKRRLAAAMIVGNDDRCRQEQASRLEALAARQKQAEPWAKLNDLIGSADGAKFRTIVQGRTLDLLLTYANAQLELLSARYRLERLRPSLNLIVIDRDMADERRSVHSLSGGESFLVSLALALGLASLTSNRIRIESLFIDEGFGSLDQATLGTAMNALMHLEAQGRKVGVISHVTEMADAIPVQIKIVKGPGGASRVIVPGATQGDDAAVEPPKASVDAAETAAKVLAILAREGGRSSKAALRRELGCTLDDLERACAALSGRIQTEGRSLRLS